MILGIGIDLLEVNRMAKSWHRFKQRLPARMLHHVELEEFAKVATTKAAESFLAKRWAAKEAFAKAMGNGLAKGIYMPDIQITHNGQGQPQINCHGPSRQWLQRQGASCYLSISDERSMVCAVAIIES